MATVLVIGAGIGGPVIAIHLQNNGIPFVIMFSSFDCCLSMYVNFMKVISPFFLIR